MESHSISVAEAFKPFVLADVMTVTAERAAQYVRMSTDMQRYSIENQSDAIAVYARRRSLSIVRSYVDAGRSGVTTKRRDALVRLLHDVQSGTADFATILVYDASRWGRFQDVDESAHYEFLCKKAGVKVEYCAELFENDGNLAAAVLKNLKRALAGEYSRELSARVVAGQSKVVTKGFYIGSAPGFGLRRVLVDEDRNRIVELASGERKYAHFQHTILDPGNADEVETVRRVYDLFIEGEKSLSEIARILNTERIRSTSGHPWYWHSVRELLSSEKYIGNSIYNRTSRRLGRSWHRNPSHEWVRGVGAFEPIVSRQRFLGARRRLEENVKTYADGFMLDVLSSIWCRDGRLHIDIIEADQFAPSTNCYRTHFGSLSRTYQEIGYKGRKNRWVNMDIRDDMRRRLIEGIAQQGGTARFVPGSRHLLVSDELVVAVGVGRTAPSRGCNEWRFGYGSQKNPDILIIARVEGVGRSIKDYFILPYVYLPQGSWLTLSGINYKRLQSFCTATLAPFIRLCARTSVDELST
jgi:DNA invertase Pin-like site-specific DNA recombinase